MLSPSDALPPLLFLSVLSNYGLYLSYHNIVRLQEYEKQSEKAAEWSNKVAERLSKTRSTQTSGTIALLISFLTSTILLVATSSNLLLSASLANATALYFSRTHMANFWNDSVQTRIPFVEKFNEAIRGSEKVVWILGTLSFGWALAGGMWMAIGRAWIASGAALAIWALLLGLRVLYMMKLGWGI